MKKRTRRGIPAGLALLSDESLSAFFSSAGVSLVELMIAVAILAGSVVALIGSFALIQKGIQAAKSKTFATNLAQEQLQILSQMDYYQVLVTSAPASLNSFSPSIPYDPNNFPPTTILEGGVSFQRYTYVQVAQEVAGVLQTLAPQTPDTGLRLVSVTVTWVQNGTPKFATVNTVLANPNSVMADSIISGVVTDFTTSLPISKAVVTIAENLGWRTTTGASGSYSFDLVPGSFEMMISAPGYFTKFVPVGAQANTPQTQNVTLVEMSSGSVTGNAWVSPDLVISQVVSSTRQSSGFDVEYIELFNPTWSTVTISGSYNLNIVSDSGLKCTNIPLTFNNTAVDPQHYFLIANTTTFTVNGSSYNQTGTPAEVDAYYTPAMPIGSVCNGAPVGWTPTSSLDILQRNQANAVYLTNSAGNIVDAVGWTNGGTSPGNCFGTCIPQAAGGLPQGDQIVRVSSPALASSQYGRAYNSFNNENDFAYPNNTFAPSGTYPNLTATNIQFSPFSSNQLAAFDSSGNLAPSGLSQLGNYTITGRPAIGGVITSNDGISSGDRIFSQGSSPPGPVGEFALTPVATGTWIVLITSGTYTMEWDTTTVPSKSSVYTFPSTTTILNQAANHGFITGTVVDAYGNPISPAITVSPGNAGSNATANTSTGRYTLRVSSGAVDVTANPQPGGNTSYVAMTSAAVSVALGDISSDVNFVLSQGGQISGCVTRDGTNAIPGIAVAFLDSNGVSHDQEVTNSQLTCAAGPNFTSIIMSTDTYSVEPALPSLESSNPSSATVVMVAGQTIFSTTFTITNALATVTGKVTFQGTPITTGVLIVLTTGTLSGTGACSGTCASPPTLSSSSLSASAYYAGSSLETGSYNLSVRAASYNIYGYYTTVDGKGNVITRIGKSGVDASTWAGRTVIAPILAW